MIKFIIAILLLICLVVKVIGDQLVKCLEEDQNEEIR